MSAIRPSASRRCPSCGGGYRYTPTSGIWQTVWLEPVPEVSIGRLKIVPDVDQRRVSVQAELQGAGAAVTLAVASPKLWSPDIPFLYHLQIELRQGARVIRMRKIEVLEDADGTPRVTLNGAPLFQFGPLDQGIS